MSHEVAIEYSPRRKAWVAEWKESSPEGAKEESRNRLLRRGLHSFAASRLLDADGESPHTSMRHRAVAGLMFGNLEAEEVVNRGKSERIG